MHFRQIGGADFELLYFITFSRINSKSVLMCQNGCVADILKGQEAD